MYLKVNLLNQEYIIMNCRIKIAVKKLLNIFSNFVSIDKVKTVEVKKAGGLTYGKKIISLSEEAMQSNHLEIARKLIDNLLLIEPLNLEALK